MEPLYETSMSGCPMCLTDERGFHAHDCPAPEDQRPKCLPPPSRCTEERACPGCFLGNFKDCTAKAS